MSGRDCKIGLVLILDDDAGVCQSISRLMESEGYRTKAFTDPQHLLSLEPVTEPACLIMDLMLGTADGIDFLGDLRKQQHCPVILLSAFGGVPTAVQAIRAGAEDFLEKPYEPEVLVAAVARALEKARTQSQSQTDLFILRSRGDKLTSRERQVVDLVMEGLLNKEIASKLHLAEVTVKIHRAHAMKKLGARNPTELARLAGLLEFGPKGVTSIGEGSATS